MNIFSMTAASVGLVLCAQIAQADHPQLAGSYVYIPERSANIEKAVEQTVADMNFVARPVARSRLVKTNQPYQRITLGLNGEQVSITTDKRAPIVTKAGTPGVSWTREDGERMQVSTAWTGPVLVQTFAAEDGKRVNHFQLNAEGKELAVKVHVSSSKLKKPLTYTLVYKRL